MYKILQNKVTRSGREIVGFARDLVKIPSISLKEERLAEAILRKMKDLEYDRAFRDDWGNVIGVIYGQMPEPTLILNSHMDTVDIKDMEKWHGDPFSAEIENGRLWGVGASDCKSGLAAQVYTGAVLKHSLLPLKGNIVVAATVAEENGRSIGVRALIEETLPSLGLKPSYAILGETTNLDLYYGHEGWVVLDILVEGEQPFHVEDAASGIYRELGEDYGSRRIGEEEEESFLLQPPRYEDVPGRRRARIELAAKIQQNEHYENLVSHVKKNAMNIAENYGTVAVLVDVKKENQKLYTGKTVVVKNVTNSWLTDPYHPLIERSRQTLAAAGCLGDTKKWQLNRLEMGTAGSVLVNEFHIPTVGYGPGLLDMAHAVNECVPVENIARAVYGSASIAHGLVGYPVFGWTSDEI